MKQFLYLLSVLILCSSLAWAQEQPRRIDKQEEFAVSSITPQADFKGLARACAGGIDDAVHTFRLQIKVNNLAQDELLTLRFNYNRGRDYGDGRARKTAKLRTLGGEWSETLQARPNQDRVLEVEVLSSDIICKMRLVASTGDKEIGSVWCDFGAAESLRRFTDPFAENDGKDNGWLFYGRAYPPSSVSKAKMYLKFKVDPTLGDVNGNWKVVNNHQLEFALVDAHASSRTPAVDLLTKPEEIASYGSIINSDGSKTLTRIVTTSRDGSASVEVKSEPKVGATLTIGFTDYSQWEDEDKSAPRPPNRLPPVQSVEVVPTEGETVEWRSIPDDIRGTVIYGESTKQNQQDKFFEHRIGESSTRDRLVFDFSSSNTGYTPKELSEGYGSSAYRPRLSPDGKRATFHTPRFNQYLDGCHDLYVGEIATGKYELLKEYLFGNSEKWSPDSRSVAVVEGSLDTIFGHLVAPGLTVKVLDVATKSQRMLLTDDTLNRDTLSWMPNSDLLFDASPGSYTAQGYKATPPQLYKSSTRGTRIVAEGANAVTSSDNRWIAFYGMEDIGKKYGASQMALSVMRPDGTGRRALNRERGGLQSTILWTNDNKSLLSISRDENPSLTTIKKWNIETGRFYTLARIRGLNYEEPQPLQKLSKNGRYLLFSNDEWRERKSRGDNMRWSVRTWLALDLETGKLQTLAVFRFADFNWREE